ncbi:glutaredoxin domain-containing protein [Phycicoccus sp.]|uniref:glutaredoxin domain-containing protein n=1 Tax=Phycicoccus sp. TaxID=1902410 RepID=UPI002D1FA55D|nr:glutaredoxin domain-containing protein [Phycicoccus sp.]
MERRGWMVVGAAGLAIGVFDAATGSWWAAVLTVLGLGTVAWWMSPWRGSPAPATHAHVVAAAAPVVVYWRPGCAFCERLRRSLGPAGREAAWVDIWRDPDAAAFVRGVNDGNETVPTVVLDGVPHTNPDPDLVRAALTR